MERFKTPEDEGNWMTHGNAAKLGDIATKGGVGAVLAVVVMFASNFKDDQRTILEKFNALEIRFVQNDADKNEMRTQIARLVSDVQSVEKDAAISRDHSRRNLEALKMLARELSAVSDKNITIPPLGDF